MKLMIGVLRVCRISEVGRRASFALAALDEVIELLAPLLIHWGLDIVGKGLFPYDVGLAIGIGRARRRPLLKVAPVGQDRCVKGFLITGQRLLRAEEMAARADFADGGQA